MRNSNFFASMIIDGENARKVEFGDTANIFLNRFPARFKRSNFDYKWSDMALSILGRYKPVLFYWGGVT